MNEGVVAPEPEVLITYVSEQREIELVTLPWSMSGGKWQEILLTVHRHRGQQQQFVHSVCSNVHGRLSPPILSMQKEYTNIIYRRPNIIE